MAKKSTYAYSFEGETMLVKDRTKENTPTLAMFDGSEYSDEIREKLFLYGMKQKIVDSASEGDSPAERLDMMIACHERLLQGEWASEREGGARTVSPEVEALAQIKQVTIPQIQKALASKDEETRKKILANPKVQELAKIIRAEREAIEDIDLDDME